jgi:hypothetical protein
VGVKAKGCHRHWELRCRFPALCRRGYRRKFAVSPNRAILEVFLFPDGNSALESINGEAAGIEGRGAMGCADGNEHAGFTDFKAAKPVNDGYAMNAVFPVELSPDFAHFCQGHGFVSLIVKVESRAIVGLVADEPVEGHDGAVFRRTHVPGQYRHFNGLAHQLVDVFVGQCRHVDASAAAYWREESDFVTGSERRIPSGKFVVSRSDHRSAVFCKF